MKTVLKWLLLCGLLGSLAHASELPTLEMKTASALSPELITGSQPSQTDLEKLKAAGVTTVINLRGSGEDAGFDEAAAAKALGLRYISIPIAGAADITADNAAKLDAAMRNSDGKMLVHCASSNRVGALLALRAAAAGQSVEEAMAFARSAGLTSTSLEQVVRERLTAPAASTPTP